MMLQEKNLISDDFALHKSK